MSGAGKPSIVFCHGLWADGSCFTKVIGPLQAQGYVCIAAQYPVNTPENDITFAKPTDNALVESFNRRVHQQLLNPSWFDMLEQARREVGAWRRDCNEIRPHRGLGKTNRRKSSF